MAQLKRTPLIRVRRKTTFTDGENVRVVEQDSQPPSTRTKRSKNSKKPTPSSKLVSKSFRAGKNLWNNVPTAIRFAQFRNVGLKHRNDPDIDERLDEMCHKAFVSGELDERAYTLEEIGNYCNISRERVRQIQEEALTSMRALMKQHFGWELSLEDMLKADTNPFSPGNSYGSSGGGDGKVKTGKTSDC